MSRTEPRPRTTNPPIGRGVPYRRLEDTHRTPPRNGPGGLAIRSEPAFFGAAAERVECERCMVSRAVVDNESVY
jgi:hypothetical protein